MKTAWNGCRIALCSALLALCASESSAADTATRIPLNNRLEAEHQRFRFPSGNGRAVIPDHVRDGIRLPRPYPDPAAAAIEFKILSKESPYKGRVLISGIITNAGDKPYVSSPRQQAVSLHEGRRLLKSVGFSRLNPGQSIKIEHIVDWVNPGGEFVPNPRYTVSIGYDPDIFLDSNPQNDDGNLNNNSRHRDGHVINEMLR